MDYEWKVYNDLPGSDHFPITLEKFHSLHEYRLSHGQINKAKWEVFESLCKLKLLQDPNIIDQTNFTETRISIANKIIA